MGLLDGKVAIITGAGGGIGRCHALLFAKEGARVVVNDVGGSLQGSGQSSRMADQVVEEIKAAGGEAVANYDSVSTVEGADGILKTALEAYGRADILVNNAGILRDKTLLKLEEGNFDAVIAVHLRGTFLCSQAFARHVKERADQGDAGGRIVNTTSYAGLMGNFGQTNYAAAKAGIAGMTRTWALELARLKVTVNALAPMAKTRMTEDISAVPEEMQPEQVAPMALFLASELAADVNGRIFGVHGQQLLEYKMKMTDGVTKEGSALWTAQEIAEELEAIAAEAPLPAAPAAPAAPAGPEQVIATAFRLLPEVFVPEKAKGWTANVHFDIQGGSPWTVTVADAACTTREGKHGEPTCVVTVDLQTYADVVQGKQKAEQAFMAGKIKATNLGDMMKFGAAFDMKKAKELAARHAPAPAAGGAVAAPQPPTDEQVIARAFELLPEVFVPAKAQGWTANVHFDIQGASPWTVTVKDGACTTRQGKHGDPSCVVTVDVKTYADVVRGTQKAEQAFMAGKIKATNLGDMMKFGAAFDMKKAKELAKQHAPAPAAAAAPAGPPSDEQIIAQAFRLLPEVFVPEKAKGWTGNVHFDIQGASPWTVTVQDGTCTTREGKHGDPTCVVTVDAKTYAEVVQGKQKAEQAFMAGKIKATNLGDMMKFGAAFDMKKAKELAQRHAPSGAPAAGAGAVAAPQPATDEEVIAQAFRLLPEVFVPDKAKGWTGNVHFDIQGASPWTVTVKDGTCTTREGKHGDPTCVVTVDVKTYADVVRGTQKAEQAFMAGKIKATNLGDMMKFGAAFDMKKAKELAARHAPAPSGASAAAAAPAAGPQELVDRAFAALPQAFKPEAVGGWSAVIHFAIEGGDDWTVRIDSGSCATNKGLEGQATCTVTTRLEDYAKVIAGELKAEQAFMQGRLSASNLGEMMKFGRAFDMKRVQELVSSGGAAPAATPTSRLDRACVGKVHAGGEPQFVRPEHAELFARATQDENRVYFEERGGAVLAPPMLSVRLLKDVLFRTIGDEELGADLLRLVHGEQDMEFLRPLHHWDLCATRAEVTGIEEKSTGELLRVEERLYTGGELAVRVKASMFIRGPGGGKKDKGKAAAEAPAERPALAFSEQVTVAEDQSLRYAEASLDNNPIHTDSEVAKLAGFKGVILQGLCTMSFAAKAVIGQAAAGDPTRLARLAVRFSKPVLMGDVLTTEAWEEGTQDGVTVYGLRVVNQDGVEVITNGRAEVRQA